MFHVTTANSIGYAWCSWPMSTQCFGSSSLWLTYPSHTITSFPSTIHGGGVQLSQADDDNYVRYVSAEIRRVRLSVLKTWTSVKYQVCPGLLYDLDLLCSLKPNFLFCNVNINIHSVYVTVDQNPNEKMWMNVYMNCKWQQVWKGLWRPIIRALGREPGLRGGGEELCEPSRVEITKHGLCSQGAVSPLRWAGSLWEESLK